MRIESIKIDNFRGLRSVDIPQLDKRVNLFVGINGSGKSSILDALALVFSWFTARMLSPKGRGRDISKFDVSLNSSSGCLIELGLPDGDIWKLFKNLKYRKKDSSNLSSMNKMIANLRDKLEIYPDEAVPLIAYYGVERIVSSVSIRGGKRDGFSQLEAYRNALRGGNTFDGFFKWFKQSEDYENERFKENQDFRDRGLETVRRVVKKIFPEYSDLKVSRRPLAMTIRKGEEVFRIDQLSEGEKNYIALVCDIARRLVLANPVGDPLQGEGIIMIDEVDLHLHPAWQQTIVSKLTDIFPNCQFFMTTHSPVVASDVKGKVFLITDGMIEEHKTYGKLSKDILTNVFNVSNARNLTVQAIIDNAYASIEMNKNDQYKDYMLQLTDILGADDVDVAGLRIEKMRHERLLAK